MSNGKTHSSRIRHLILLMIVSMTCIAYLDRVCISVAALSIRDELGFDKLQMGYAFSSFFLAYSLAQVPAGWLGDRFGARIMLTGSVLTWSLLTALTGLVEGLEWLILIRLLFGVSQAGAFPIATRVISVWVSFSRRAQASGLVTFGSRAGSALAFTLTTYLIVQLGGWRPVFLAYALVGVVWAVCFWWLFRNSPEEHPRCTPDELRLITADRPTNVANPRGIAQTFPSGFLRRSKSLWLLCMMHLLTNTASVFLVTWLPVFLQERYELNTSSASSLASIPVVAGMCGCLLGGWITDRLTLWLGLKWGRSLPGVASKILAATATLGSLISPCPLLAVVSLAIASFTLDFGLTAALAYVQDAGGPYAGTLLGWVNTFGNLGSFISPILLGWLAEEFSWSMTLGVCISLYLLSGFCWLGVDARQGVVGSHTRG
jgi:sugar phosphate permease